MSTNAAPARRSRRFDRGEIRRLVAMYGFVAALHVVGFGLFAYYNARYQGLADSQGTLLYAGAAGLAYTLGMRHAFDADHISAIDDTTRYLLQKGKRPLGLGLSFSLGHSSVVFGLSVGIAFAAQAANRFQTGFAEIGGVVGTLVSGVFLYAIAALNFAVLRGIFRTWREAKAGQHEPEELEQLLADRGLMNRVFKGRYNRFIEHSWQLYFVGLLFGLGFDTATQVGALGLAAGSAADGTLPPLAIIALPLIFAAGMSLMDTTDGVFMAKAYEWSFSNPVRKIYYNLTMTGLSIFVAFVVGTVELVSLLADQLGAADQRPWSWLAGIDLNTIGIVIVVTFLVTWIGAVALWKLRHFDERYPGHHHAREPELDPSSA
ncbi:HoxN/HupN/NixA family nickel/cobalt transporter [Streptomyces sp. WAC00263]|uniref:HoxN/HupN/NixA family nickel/cobalt transporter n=1 Tax=Streptomyces sp. WAC00263 TaxID=1917422 RepID=UPI0015EE683F|nr:HoxN/HupN/NixA family nickel/cobalt transporter [Streptomyces sp. WAC00263]KAF5990717.1 HoxN/HupN/NixA family nickel/cobalt transporter [Streptomyces sp. WAC00263]